ncbi:MAG: nuclear transport factor 2 family protein [Hyphomicrobiales bacterium]
MSALHALEDRLRAVEDTLAIYHLIASHPPAADTGTDSYYRNAFTDGGEVDLGGGKGARGNAAIAAIVKTPEHQAAIAGGLCHFAGLPRVEINGDTAVATSYLQIITPDGRQGRAKSPAMAARAVSVSIAWAPTVGSSSAARTAGK